MSYSQYAASANGIWSWKDSYRWVDFDADASRQVDEELTSKWNNTNEKSFSFALTAGSWFNQSSNKGNYTCYVELNSSRTKISKIYQKNKNTSYQREMRRTPAFVLPRGNKDKLGQLFDKSYADAEEKDIMSQDGMIKFFKDNKVNPDGHETLIIAQLLQCEEMGIISRDEFVDGFYKNGCMNKSDVQQCVQRQCQIVNGSVKSYKKFYKWIFVHVKEDEKKKQIPMDLAIALWNILFKKEAKSMKLLKEWMAYCEKVKDKELKVVSRDLWEQIYDFLKETNSIDSYDDAGGSWPIAVDEFVEYLQENAK